MRIAILTSGILPVPAVRGGAVETLTDYYLEYNGTHGLHDITVYSIHHKEVGCQQETDCHNGIGNHYQYIDTNSLFAKAGKQVTRLLHKLTPYHYSIEYFFRQALRKIACQHYDVIIIENRPGFGPGLRKKTDALLVYHLHNDMLNASTWHNSEIYQAATKIITVSDYIKNRVQTCCLHDTKTATVYNGIDIAQFSTDEAISRKALGFNADDFVLAFSGRLIPEKGILELIEAMTKLASCPKIKLMVMGSSFYGINNDEGGFIQKLKSMADTLSDRIVFTGYVRHEDMGKYLRAADVAVLPSTWDEPFGLTIVEGMAAGLPVITTNRGGIPEIVSEENAIILPYPANPGNDDDNEGKLSGQIADAILSLYRDAGKRAAMGRASQEAAAKFSKEAYARNFFEAIATVRDL